MFSPILNNITFKKPKDEEHLTTLYSAVILGILCSFLAVLFTKLTAGFFYLKKRFGKFIIYRRQILYVYSYYLFIYLFLLNVVHIILFYSLIVTLVTSITTFPDLFGDYMSHLPFETLKELLGISLTDSDSSESESESGSWGRWGIIPSLLIMLVLRVILK